MKAQKSENYSYGFILDEKNYRRLIDIANEQLEKVSDDEDLITKEYIVHLKSGAIITTGSLDEIFIIENSGQTQIINISSIIKIKDKHKVEIYYNNTDINDNYYPIYYSIESMDRDWVIITQSKLEDRILQTKRSTFWAPKLNLNSYSQIGAMSVILALFILIIIKPFEKDFDKTYDDYKNNNNYILTELKKNEGKDISAINSLIKYETIKKDNNEIREKEYENYIGDKKIWEKNNSITKVEKILILLLSMLTLPFFSFIYRSTITKIYPLYVFNWSDYKTVFAKKEAQRKFILVTILTSTVISIVSGIVVNLI